MKLRNLGEPLRPVLPKTTKLSLESLTSLPVEESTPLPESKLKTIDLIPMMSNNPIQGLSRQIIEQSTLVQKNESYTMSVHSAVSGLLNASQKEIIHEWLNQCTQSKTSLNFIFTEKQQSSPNQQRIEQKKHNNDLILKSLKQNPDIQSIVKCFTTKLDENNVVTTE